MNIYAYFDESGTHKGSPAFSVGGFLARADEWAAFTVAWEDALAEWGLPFFHMADFENRRPGYDWPDDVRRERISKLLGLIERHTLGSVGTVLPVAEYDVVFPKDEPPEEPNTQQFVPGIWTPWSQEPGEPEPEVSLRPGDCRRKSGGPYGLAAIATMFQVAEIVRPLRGDPHVAYVFEQGAVGAGQIHKVFDDMYRHDGTRVSNRLLSIAFKDKAEFPPLQAADLLAYELSKHLPRQLGIETRPTRYTLKQLANERASWGWMNIEAMRTWHHVIGRGLYYSEGSWQK